MGYNHFLGSFYKTRWLNKSNAYLLKVEGGHMIQLFALQHLCMCAAAAQIFILIANQTTSRSEITCKSKGD